MSEFTDVVVDDGQLECEEICREEVETEIDGVGS